MQSKFIYDYKNNYDREVDEAQCDAALAAWCSETYVEELNRVRGEQGCSD